MDGCLAETERLKRAWEAAEAVVVGAGAGLSAAAGFTYAGERFRRYFQDFIDQYGFGDMYFGGFYPFETRERYWAYWSRYIYINRYMDAPKPVYQRLYSLVKDKDYFVLTTNVDHCFQKAGFGKHRLFYTQGDYGLFQCSGPCHQKNYDNESVVREMLQSQGFKAGADGTLALPEGTALKTEVLPSLVPCCPVCGKPMAVNLRADGSFVEDEGWHTAAGRYQDFLARHQRKSILFVELGVGYNTPGIIKYPFWRMANEWKNAEYICINAKEAYAPEGIKDRSICIRADIGEVLAALFQKTQEEKPSCAMGLNDRQAILSDPELAD